MANVSLKCDLLNGYLKLLFRAAYYLVVCLPFLQEEDTKLVKQECSY